MEVLSMFSKINNNLSHEQAIIIASELKNPSNLTAGGLEVVTGRHPVHGPIHVVLSAMGSYLLLPALLPVANHLSAL